MKFSYQKKSVELIGVSETDWIYSNIKNSATFYEIDLLKYIEFVLKGQTGTILDVGANIGNHAVFFGLYIADLVICFEPNPMVVPILKTNLQANNIKFELHEIGLGEFDGKASVDLPTSSINNMGAAKLIENTGNDDSIIVRSLDKLMAEIKPEIDNLRIMAIKMDVEGMEPSVLKGALNVLRKFQPDLFIEIQNESQMTKIEAILKPLGYRKIVSWAATPVWHFIHEDKDGLTKKIRLLSYIITNKSIHFASIFAKKIWRKIK